MFLISIGANWGKGCTWVAVNVTDCTKCRWCSGRCQRERAIAESADPSQNMEAERPAGGTKATSVVLFQKVEPKFQTELKVLTLGLILRTPAKLTQGERGAAGRGARLKGPGRAPARVMVQRTRPA